MTTIIGLPHEGATIVRDGQFEPEQPQQDADERRGLSKREVEDEPNGQHQLDHLAPATIGPGEARPALIQASVGKIRIGSGDPQAASLGARHGGRRRMKRQAVHLDVHACLRIHSQSEVQSFDEVSMRYLDSRRTPAVATRVIGPLENSRPSELEMAANEVEPRSTDATIRIIERELLDALDRANPRLVRCGITCCCNGVPPAPMIVRKIQVERNAVELRGTVALVTGGNGGLGQRICRAIAKKGAHIAVVYTQSREQAEDVARDLATRHQVSAAAFACELTDQASVEKLAVDVVARFGRLDILVNDAAFNKSVPFTDLDGLTQELWDKIIAVNLTGPMRLIKAAAPALKSGGNGRIVNVASVAGLSPSGSSIAYAVSKAGLIHLTKCMAVALAPDTLVNCVAPGLLQGTRATANLRPEMIERGAASSLLKKPADKDDCADMVVTMCRTDTMTGQTVVIDAGRVFH